MRRHPVQRPCHTDDLWAAIAPLPPPVRPKLKGGRSPIPDRAALAGILFVLKSGLPWEMLPAEMGCGSGMSCWRRRLDRQAAGVRAALHRVLLERLHGAGHHGPRAHDGTIIPETVDSMRGADLTTTRTGEGQAAVFVAVDHCSAGCVGLHAARRATRFEALEPVRRGVRRRFGGFAEGIAAGLALRHDHGSRYMADDFQREIAFRGIGSSPAFVRAPEGNGCAERFIRALEENLSWVRTFGTVEELRAALLEFRVACDAAWPIERHGFRPPGAVRQDQLSVATLAA